ncbi:MAG: hypothetical protein A3E37_01775 [Candidatus Andersenbacteria bacterium RIFCSPHIGHO2_12_FULL_46_9]|nr:MAG: Prolipoprotein diacylglyceryl transferase [Parcubacteria group bacterium GW2011_GWA2_45_14]OGY35474.1 MAG: hypothetical protein A3B76_01720 [Candidatus Andersenbacteria bacterium RIFCSPHIGHO2_02_FULL_46_16]OGY36887.1 MAG: hypothetical protein A3I08_05655 [Candidatus Andersenbacteria bacterium RIFCSPLOWO2_02_FULL_46_11]OGY38219.1 MAG: hypothetical protein A3E37_01775 [Candidatus Andersenbacteria bacterium RIFCSPHIGHO2_12_FULL_46_9]OGY42121.1 MAG: hypothetical protein A3G57_01355 [Candida
MIELFPSREVALGIGSWSVHWYGVLYVLAFGMGLGLALRLQKYRGLHLRAGEWLEVVTWVMAGVLIGGRLGYVLLYGREYFWEQPGQIFNLGQGGMASHGGFVGVAIALWLASRLQKLNYWQLMDVVVVPIALGLSLGRIGNVINQEIFTTLLAQILAVGKDLVIAGVVWWHLRRAKGRAGKTTALFLGMYGVLRFLIEYGREQAWPIVSGLTRGQWYTVPIIVAGVGLWWYFKQTDDQAKTTSK